MKTFLTPFGRSITAAAVVGGSLTLGPGTRPVAAQQAPEVRCYLMVCTGTTCVAKQIACPPQEEDNKPAPGSST